MEKIYRSIWFTLELDWDVDLTAVMDKIQNLITEAGFTITAGDVDEDPIST